jgi:signal transduction histidine kinase
VNASAWIRWAAVAAASVVLAGLLMLTSPMRRLDLWAGDLQARLAVTPRTVPDTVVVAIDDDSIARLTPVLGNWPYNRAIYARVADYLTRAGARAIVFDILFADERAGDPAFADALQHAAPTTLAAVATPYAMPGAMPDVEGRSRAATLGWQVDGLQRVAPSWHDVELPRATFTASTRVGVANLVPDEDGLVRRLALLHDVGGVLLPALPFAAVFPDARQPPAVRVEGGLLHAGGRAWPIDRHGDVHLLFASSPHAIAEVPFSRLADAALDPHRDDEQTRALFRGRTVFIGATALLIGPANQTPIGPLPGVVLAAQAYAALAHDQVLRPMSWWRNALLLAITLALPFAVRARRTDSIALLIVGTAAGLIACWALNWLLLTTARQPTSLVLPMLAGGTAFVAFLAERVYALRLARQRLASERLAVERTAALKQEFLVHVSHELRTPLTAIIGFSGMLADDAALDDEKRTLAQVARRNAQQLLWQVNNLLDQARITAGQMLIDPGPTSIADVLDHVMATLAGVPRRPGVELRCSGQTEVPARLTLDGQRLQQILINLGANALKFTDHGAVHLACAWDAGWLTATIEDTGHGIPADSLQRIFEPFEQSPSRARQGGTGLGLTISRNLAGLMGGELTVTSTVGVGSTFRLRVPAAAVPIERPAPEPSTMTSATAPAMTKLATRAVVADDSEDICTFLAVCLRRMGLEVSQAEDGATAVSLALAEHPDLVLLDVQMPIMSGPEAAQALRRAGYAQWLVALTAGSGDALESDLRAAGFDAVVFKPVTGAHLAHVITGLLATRRDTASPAPAAKAAGLT